MNEVLPTLSLFAVASLRLLPMANQVLASTIEIRFGKNGVSKVYNDIVNADNREKQTHHFSAPVLKKADKKFEEIGFKNVSFKYHSSKDWILEGLDLSIKSGESVGIIGPSGAGKTTFLDVLLGLLEPQEGKITFNQEPFEESIGQWRSQVAYLPQEIFLTDSSLKSNVALGLPLEKIDEEKVLKSLSQAKLDVLVSELPDGIETLLGENGIRLSGGQRQRVALARSFYYQRNVLILDEATSSLDNETEREIVEEIKDFKAEKTLIVIAHRYSTIEHCDRVYKLDKGRIVSQGSFQEVVG
jgi:ABC-type bacteriocin/lantibiotic exporter with double-glycine peptidase domain